MRTHVDWITFTFTPVYPDGTQEGYVEALARGLQDMFGSKLWNEFWNGEWRNHAKGRAPYSDSWTLGEMGLTLYASPILAHACVEISGKGCENLISLGYMEPILAQCASRVTRIDVACDIETSVRPRDFVTQVKHERMRAHGEQISESGETCYVGSQKSERYCRVYRYNAPHPRAHLLRVEHVFRREYAKVVCRNVAERDVDSVAAACGDAFGWAHPVWQVDTNDRVDISIVAPERQMGKTVYWLVDTVAPTFRRLAREGVIKDPEAFIQRYFLSGE